MSDIVFAFLLMCTSSSNCSIAAIMKYEAYAFIHTPNKTECFEVYFIDRDHKPSVQFMNVPYKDCIEASRRNNGTR